MQLEQLKSYPLVQEKIKDGSIQLHGWWFDIAQATVYCYDNEADQFVVIDEKVAKKIFAEIEKTQKPNEPSL